MDLTSLKRLATDAAEEAEGDWFDPSLIESHEPVSSTHRARRYIAAASPDKLLKLIAVVEAAKRYYECYAQDEADDGDYAVQGMPGHNTGCSYEQAVDAKALRSALKELDK